MANVVASMGSLKVTAMVELVGMLSFEFTLVNSTEGAVKSVTVPVVKLELKVTA